MTIFERKQKWLGLVMRSNLTNAQKVFAYAVFDRMYGDKLWSFPTTEQLEEATNLNRSKFGAHRRALFASGAMTGDKKHHHGQWANYTYTLNLDWDGEVDRVPSGPNPVP
ncbi:hypothetical protein [Nocardioides flavescens]|uniref:Helix-turn-helix domain-containing protein n=1 Tax=Nocardioides flavescens TaxID=2691959 RepID=A0A6L7EVY1_9ACTN|nr:hypothetical protein [Nocardioides flavescens]MXG91553.1 hypothetical protein [Nocardioides flavescens]